MAPAGSAHSWRSRSLMIGRLPRSGRRHRGRGAIANRPRSARWGYPVGRCGRVIGTPSSIRPPVVGPDAPASSPPGAQSPFGHLIDEHHQRRTQCEDSGPEPNEVPLAASFGSPHVLLHVPRQRPDEEGEQPQDRHDPNEASDREERLGSRTRRIRHATEFATPMPPPTGPTVRLPRARAWPRAGSRHPPHPRRICRGIP